jgi:hypothetical protein
MTTEIVFSDDRFAFKQDGVTFLVRTEVGDGPARVVVEEVSGPQVPLEPEGDEEWA